jgi:hypothetical protein
MGFASAQPILRAEQKLGLRLRGDERRNGKPIKKIIPQIFCIRCAVRNVAR